MAKSLIGTPSFVARIRLFTICQLFVAANIVALIQSPSNAIQTFADLVRSPLLLGIDASTFDGQTVQAELHIDYANISDVRSGVARIQSEYFAFLGVASTIYRAIGHTFEESEKCSLGEIHILPYPMNTILVAKHSPIRELLKRR